MVHFGVVVVVNIMLGLITPPYGLLLFVTTQRHRRAAPRHRARGDAVPLRDDRRCCRSSPSCRSCVLWLPRLFGYEGDMNRQGLKPIFILNGPNLNRLGTREPEIYGTTTLAEIEAQCRRRGGTRSSSSGRPTAKASWSDGSMRPSIGPARFIINPAALTFTSVALLDALPHVPGTDHRGPHLQHPRPAAAAPGLADLAGAATGVIAEFRAAGAICWRCRIWPERLRRAARLLRDSGPGRIAGSAARNQR